MQVTGVSRPYRLKNPVRVMLEQSRPIYWFPLIGVTMPGFFYLFAVLFVLTLLIKLTLTPLFGCCGCVP